MSRAPFLLLFALLMSCGPLVQIGGNSPRPDALYTLTATAPAAVPAGQVPVDMASAVTVQVPTVPGALQTLRIPVSISDTAVQYVKAGQWSEQPNRLFQRLISDTLVHGGIAVVDPRASGVSARRILSGQLVAFGVDSRMAAPLVRVRFDATLSTPAGLRQRRFERAAPLAAVESAQVAAALNLAANQVAADVAAWVGRSG